MELDKINEDDIGGVCSMHGTLEKSIQNFSRKTGREENSEGLDVDRRVMLEWILGK
jgi:hypothetical protein